MPSKTHQLWAFGSLVSEADPHHRLWAVNNITRLKILITIHLFACCLKSLSLASPSINQANTAYRCSTTAAAHSHPLCNDEQLRTYTCMAWLHALWMNIFLLMCRHRIPGIPPLHSSSCIKAHSWRHRGTENLNGHEVATYTCIAKKQRNP